MAVRNRLKGGETTGARAFLETGVALLYCLSDEELADARTQFLNTLYTLPEVRRDVPRLTLNLSGNVFGEIGIMSAYSSPIVRRLRQQAFVHTGAFFNELLGIMGNGLNLEQLISLVTLRPPGTEAVEYPMSRSILSNMPAGDVEVRGWLNLDTVPRRFRFIPASHTMSDDDVTGKDTSVIDVPPGAVVLFITSVVHGEILEPSADPSARLYLKWHITPRTASLFPNVRAQIGQMLPPMYPASLFATAGPELWKKLEDWSRATFVASKLVTVRKHDTTYTVVPQFMTSPDPVPPYTGAELELYAPLHLDASVLDDLSGSFAASWYDQFTLEPEEQGGARAEQPAPRKKRGKRAPPANEEERRQREKEKKQKLKDDLERAQAMRAQEKQAALTYIMKHGGVMPEAVSPPPPPFSPVVEQASQDGAFVCKCGKRFQHNVSLRAHYLREHENLLATCSICHRMYANASNVWRHCREEHAGQKCLVVYKS